MADGRIAIQTTETPEAELIPKLTAIAAERTSNKVFLRGDGSVPYERVAQVMGAPETRAVFRDIGLVNRHDGPTFGAVRAAAEVGGRGRRGYRADHLGGGVMRA